MTTLRPTLTPKRRAWLEHISVVRMGYPEDVQYDKQVSWDCLVVKWIEHVWIGSHPDRKYLGDVLTDAGRRMLEGGGE
jgi:hypothetical protein